MIVKVCCICKDIKKKSKEIYNNLCRDCYIKMLENTLLKINRDYPSTKDVIKELLIFTSNETKIKICDICKGKEKVNTMGFIDKYRHMQHYDLCNNCKEQVYNVIVNYLNRELPDLNIWKMKESNLDILKYINNKNIKDLFVFDMVIEEIKNRIVSLKRKS
jgi:hypothetical protein